MRPARRPRRDRARAHRPADAGAALQSDRLRPLVERARLCAGDSADRRDRNLRLRHYRDHRRNVPLRHHHAGRRHRRRARRRTTRIEAVGRTFAYLLHEGAPRLQIYQTDVRAIQLAKAALYAGAKLLLERYGAAAPERITLAGAFGSHIDVAYAMALGLIPDCDLGHVAAAGNAAGTGARIALLNLAGARRDRSCGAPHRENRNRARAALPGPFRRRHGDPQQDRRFSKSG